MEIFDLGKRRACPTIRGKCGSTTSMFRCKTLEALLIGSIVSGK
jgi:hypothetical protein